MKYIKLPLGLKLKIDNDDYERLNLNKRKFGLVVTPDGYRYPTCNDGNGRGTFYLHRLILKAPKGLIIDHKNRNTLDCRKINLRLATHSQNNANQKRRSNRTGYQGVQPNGSLGYSARIKKDGIEYYIGQYRTAKEASEAYNMKAKEFFGDFARVCI